jgi:beta-lactamase regulating signal transducer with metallopeptidase domain
MIFFPWIPKIDTYEKGIMAAREVADSAVIAAVLSQQHQRYAESLLESG